EAFVVRLEFWLGLTVRYRLPRRQRTESPSIGLVRDLLLGGSLRFEHLAFAFSPSSTRRRIASGRPGRSSCLRRQSSITANVSMAIRTLTASDATGGRPRFN